ncbi:hypothetical protein M8J76_007538 [Diaphorina citri]|nr:hypothetical protein M8J75_007300 [Diaphorina citri]KAI5726728.1 hypothetical protein M8J76_007538 [Diaphorina citri]KAI5730894.1 hypothetical protein M8J77_001712 [Diaphorina citri]
MTLTRTPCDFDTMSLFQDLKLKRRKLDSRCSSDGESVADTSTSSPDVLAPVSPSSKIDPRVPVSPGPCTITERTTSPDSALHEMTEESSAVLKVEENTCKEEVNNGVYDGGGVNERRERETVVVPASWCRVNGVKEEISSQPQMRRESVVTSSPGVVSSPCVVTSPNIAHSQSSVSSPPTFWVSSASSTVASSVVTACRINGVRPELIGGVNNFCEMKPPPSPQQRPASAVRSTPTVIMGEAGGVRTMIWSQPNPEQGPQPPQQHFLAAAAASTSSWSTSSQSSTSSSSNVNNEESAAQLLLNLGQDNQHLNVRNISSVNNNHQQQSQQYPATLNMERLWAGDLSQLPASQQMTALNLTSSAPSSNISPLWLQSSTASSPFIKNNGELGGNGKVGPDEHDEDDQPMICMICEDKATGLHYGIITCEGCKGFFKRTVQNRRVYTCVADGVCEITKAQRNRCQYCRFKKCIEQGMVLQAVREDRMPGGRNSGAVYNLYKVKYKKHKKTARNGQVKLEKQQQQPVKGVGMSPPEHGIPPHLVNGTILKTALTNPGEIVHLRQRLDNTVSSSRDRNLSLDATLSMIQGLVDCDEFQDIATLRNLDDLLNHKSDLSEKLMQIGDSIVYKLVQWTKRLPFYLELPVEVHTRLLTHKWHELLVLTTSAYQAIHGHHKLTSTSTDGTEAHFTQEVSNNLCTLQTCLTSMMGRPITMDQLRQDVGLMVEKITHVTLMFRRIKLRIEEYVCLKVIIMLNPSTRGNSNELEIIQERYMTCLKTFVEHTFPQQPNRFHDLLVRLPEVQSAASLLLESKMFYVPFLLNSTIQR